MTQDDDIVAEYRALLKEIARHDKFYHQEDAPVISDADYDALTKKREAMLQAHPLLLEPIDEKKVGAELKEGFKKYKHLVAMLSLDNIFKEEEVEDFYQSIMRYLNLDSKEGLTMVAEPKIDGLSMNLLYHNGRLLSAATRGDGDVGEDVTENIKTLEDIPDKLPPPHPDKIEIRGEVYITRQDFAQLNKHQQSIGSKIFANPRNAAAGSLRQLDANITKSRPLKFFAYEIGFISDDTYPTQESLRKDLARWGFIISTPAKICHNNGEVIAYYKNILDQRPELPFDIDGVVYKLNDRALQKRLGFSARNPRFATAHKFPSEIAETIINDIVIQVGRTGVLTPVAELEPINIGGAMVGRATLHNEDYIKSKDFRIGDRVSVRRAGDVIPQVLAVNKKHRKSESKPYQFPQTCPVCGSATERKSDGKELEAARRCTNRRACNAQIINRLIHATTREALDIEGLGDKQIEKFYHLDFLKTIGDIYRLDRHGDKIKNLEGFGELSWGNIWSAISQRRILPLHRFIYALGIPQVGRETAKLLARHFGSFPALKKRVELCHQDQDEIIKLQEELDGIEGVGASLAGAVVEFMVQDWAEALDLAGEVEIQPAEQQYSGGKLAGKLVVFTGSLEKLSRQEAKDTAERLGAKIGSDVSKNTDIVVMGEKAGKKADKAKSLGIKIISEDEWLEIIRDGDK